MRSIFLLLLSACFALPAQAQNAGINATGATPNASAMLDVSSTSQGVLIPRMTDAQRQLLKDPANGLMIYNTTTNEFNFYTGTNWDSIPRSGVDANSATGTGPGGGVAINTSGAVPHPSALLDVASTTKGMLIPETTPGSVTAVQGLLIYNTGTNEFNCYDGNRWQTSCSQILDNNTGTGAIAQGVGINATGAQPNASAMLDISSSTQGLLIPRMTSSQRDAIASPAQGLIIYDMSNNWVEYWSGTEWYEMINTSWASLNPAVPPTIRNTQTSVWDATDNEMIMFGGWNGTSKLGDIWKYDPTGNAWTSLSPAGSPPARNVAGAVWNSTADVMYLFGGAAGASLNDLWQYDPSANTWTILTANLAATSPAIRNSPAVVWNTSAKVMYMFGGYQLGSATYYNDLWQFNPVGNAWTQLTPTGAPPAVRNAASAVWNPTAKVMYVFGGGGTTSNYNDLWQYDPSTNAWTQLTPAGTAPSMRWQHSAVWNSTANVMYVFGGLCGNTITAPSNDLWQYDPAANRWTELNPCAGGLPSTRYGHTAVWDFATNEMYVFGGANSSFLNDLWEY